MSLVVNHTRSHGSRIVHHVAMHRVWGVGRDPERRGGGEEEEISLAGYTKLMLNYSLYL